MLGFAGRLLPYALAFTSSLCIMILELVSSRLVARHVGSSLTVWTSVIGIILGGICLGNVLGGRLADRVEPRRAVGPLFALGAFLTLGSLWMNAEVGHLIPSPEQHELGAADGPRRHARLPGSRDGPGDGRAGRRQDGRRTGRRRPAARSATSTSGARSARSPARSCAASSSCTYAPTSTIVLVVAAALALLAAALIGETAGAGRRAADRSSAWAWVRSAPLVSRWGWARSISGPTRSTTSPWPATRRRASWRSSGLARARPCPSHG